MVKPFPSPDRRGHFRDHLPATPGGRFPRAPLLSAVALALAIAAGGSASAQAPEGAVAPGWTGAQAPRIVVSLQARTLWLVAASDTLLEAPVAVGRRESFRYRGKRYDWATPRGTRRIVEKRRDPVWTVPEWHYLERAANEGLKLVRLAEGRRYTLGDGSWLAVRNGGVIRGQEDRYWNVPRGREIVIDGTLYVPPPGSLQRRVPDALGSRALDLGDGYLIHGTHEYNEDSIGEAASHGCIRMRNADIERLFERVEAGTPVLIY